MNVKISYAILILLSFLSITHIAKANIFTLSDDCRSYLWEQADGTKPLPLTSLLTAAENKLTQHFKDMLLTYPQSKVLQLHFYRWQQLNTNTSKIKISCQPNSLAVGEVAIANVAENSIILSSITSHNLLTSGNDMVLFHEVYHFLSGFHGEAHLDYTILCTAAYFGFEPYLNSVGPSSPLSLNNQHHLKKLCATSEINALMSQDHLENALQFGLLSYVPDIWIRSVSNAFCQQGKKFIQTCKKLQEILKIIPPHKNYLLLIKELLTLFLLENSSDELFFSQEISKPNNLQNIATPRPTVIYLLQQLSESELKLLATSLFHLSFTAHTMTNNPSLASIQIPYHLQIVKNNWLHWNPTVVTTLDRRSSKKITFPPGQSYQAILFFNEEKIGSFEISD